MPLSDVQVEQLFDSSLTELCFFANRFLCDKAASEDVVMDVFIKLWKRRERFQDEKFAKSFWYKATKNACFNHLRKQKVISTYQRWLIRERGREEMDDIVVKKVLEAELAKEWDAAVESLPERCLRVVKIFLAGKTVKEIAGLLGQSQEAVRKTLRQAKTLLRQRLSPDFDISLFI